MSIWVFDKTHDIVRFPSHNQAMASRESRERTGGNSSLCAWGITCVLLAIVSAIFAFGGTAGEPGGHYARVIMVGFLVVALMFFIRRTHRDQR